MFIVCYGVVVVMCVLLFCVMFVVGLLVGVGFGVMGVVSYNLFVVLYWMVLGCSVGGIVLYLVCNWFGWMEVLCCYMVGSVWFFVDEYCKGVLVFGWYVDFVVLSDDYFLIDVWCILMLLLVLMVVDGKVVYVE